ncbi:MAG TPA: hypothetical protein VN371_01635 [Chlorobaculum sp.]|nr:hypothetical protein [Chlorobaculum sp.]
MKRRGFAALAVVICCALNGCVRQPDELAAGRGDRTNGVSSTGDVNAPGNSIRNKPLWLDIYREKSLVGVSTVDHVVIVRFETLGSRDEVYRHYARKFGEEENFSTFRQNRDIISFIREGIGVKITLLDQSKNLWSLEYHRQSI